MDTHVHAASGMNQKHLLRFIKRKMKYNADDIVMVHEGKEVTLREVNTATNLVVFFDSFIALVISLPILKSCDFEIITFCLLCRISLRIKLIFKTNIKQV